MKAATQTTRNAAKPKPTSLRDVLKAVASEARETAAGIPRTQIDQERRMLYERQASVADAIAEGAIKFSLLELTAEDAADVEAEVKEIVSACMTMDRAYVGISLAMERQFIRTIVRCFRFQAEITDLRREQKLKP